MREILFRGERIANGKWVEGYLFKQFISFVGKEESYIRYFDIDYLVDSETVGQYVGFTDKNGRKIFEEDIIQNDKGDIGIVQWFPEHSAFMVYIPNQHKVCFLYDNDFSTIEVIGNTFDNLELIQTD